MASTSMSSGRWLKVEVCATIGGTYVPVLGMNGYTQRTQRATDVTDTYEGIQYTEAGTRDKTYHMEGGFISDDPGQLLVRAAEAADSVLYAKVTPSGRSSDSTENVRAFIAPVQIASTDYSSPIGTKQKYGFDMIPNGIPAASGAGGYVL